MLKSILELKGTQKLSKKEQKTISGGIGPIYEDKRCGGDGSFIFVNGVKTCCYIPSQNNYIC
ncbi:hypothetical protein SY27_09565 [Flavobacterium sp. 316]|uniref:Bacteriocin-like protein n=1 Tax=Flavobacterium sediminilitoris TaxID=2024526 RepID=A0ABY4HQV9_9FLAO|nr:MULTISPECIES: hypothetical protein [Flavobacterium]KIX21013.1 hypothetical protein SY27_09565 [Flavobacterium sp. 316]UOX35263.1 hypothetical protein LXD69_07030 [Flavobacterium sediminilitoris]